MTRGFGACDLNLETWKNRGIRIDQMRRESEARSRPRHAAALKQRVLESGMRPCLVHWLPEIPR